MADSHRTETVSPSPGSPGAIRIFAPGTEVGARFAIRDVLGTGGYAVVYRAWDRVLSREVALKVLRADRMTEVSLKRLRREVTVARDAESPRLVRIYDIEQADDAAYLTMELVDGPSLRERVKTPPIARKHGAKEVAARAERALATPLSERRRERRKLVANVVR